MEHKYIFKHLDELELGDELCVRHIKTMVRMSRYHNQTKVWNLKEKEYFNRLVKFYQPDMNSYFYEIHLNSGTIVHGFDMLDKYLVFA